MKWIDRLMGVLIAIAGASFAAVLLWMWGLLLTFTWLGCIIAALTGAALGTLYLLFAHGVEARE